MYNCWDVIPVGGQHVWSTDGHLTVPEIYDLGDWGSWDTCPTGSYAAGISLKVNQYVDNHLLFIEIMHSIETEEAYIVFFSLL